MIDHTDRPTLSGWTDVTPGTQVYSDEHSGGRTGKWSGMGSRDQAHTNGIESFWSLLKRCGHIPQMSKKRAAM